MEHIPDNELNTLTREYQSGLTYKAIAEKHYIDQRTAKRYVQLNLSLEEYEHRPYSSILDPYKEQIRQAIEPGDYSVKEIFEDLKQKGYTGSYSLLYRFIREQL